MPAYLKIENIGVCPPEGFTFFGVSLADTSNNSGVIGQFGSGSKHACAVLLRNELSLTVKEKYDFYGNGTYYVKLMLADEEISEIEIDVRNQ